MKNNIVTVLNKINEAKANKIELASNLVEFGVIDDVAKNTDEMKSIAKSVTANAKVSRSAWDKYDKLTAEVKKAEEMALKAAKPLEKNDAEALKAMAKSEKIWDKLKKAADALGVDVKDVKGYSEWTKAEQDLEKVLNDSRELYK